MLSTTSSTSTLAFGNVLVGTTNNGNPGQLVTVENTGGGTLTGSFGGVANGFNPTTAQGFSLGANATDDRTYNFAPTLRGAAADTLNITSDGGNAALNLTGQGVAPVAAVNTASSNAGLVRIGASGTASVTIQNTGDGNLSGLGAVSNLNGSVSNSAGVFSGPGGVMSLTDGASQAFSYAYTPTGHVADNQSISVTTSNGNPSGDNSGFNQSVLLQGQGVGPIYDSLVAPGGTLNFGEVYLGDTASLNLSISNTTTDSNGGDPLLTRMTLVGISLVGDPDFFVSSSFIGTTIDAGDTFNLAVHFAPVFTGMRTGTLLITTDVGAALGQVGQTFTYNLQGIGIVPEPATTVLLISSLGIVLGTRRRIRSN